MKTVILLLLTSISIESQAQLTTKLSALPNTNNIQAGDYLIGITIKNGITNDIKIPIENLISNKLSVNLIGAYNFFPPDNGVLQSAQQTPLHFVDSWLDYYPYDYPTNFGYPPQNPISWPSITANFGDPGEYVFTNEVRTAKTNGLLAAGVNWVGISDGWATNGRVNGHLVPNATKFPHGITNGWLANYAHTNGFKITIYVAWDGLVNDPLPNSSSEKEIAQDIRDFKSWGFDGLIVDTSIRGWQPTGLGTPTPAQYRTYIRAMMEGVASCADTNSLTPGFSLIMSVNNGDWTLNKMTNMVTPYEVAMGLNGLHFFEGQNLLDQNVLESWVSYVRDQAFTLRWFNRPGHCINWNGFTYNGFNTTLLNNIFKLRAMSAGGGSYTLNSITGTPSIITNAEFMSYWDDPTCLMGYQTYSNNLSEVWARPIGSVSSGIKLCAFINATTNGNVSLPITTNELGVSSSTLMVVRDIINHTNVDYFTGSYNVGVGSTNVILYLMYPAAYGAAPFIANGYIQSKGSAGSLQFQNQTDPNDTAILVSDSGATNNTIRLQSTLSAGNDLLSISYAGGQVRIYTSPVFTKPPIFGTTSNAYQVFSTNTVLTGSIKSDGATGMTVGVNLYNGFITNTLWFTNGILVATNRF